MLRPLRRYCYATLPLITLLPLLRHTYARHAAADTLRCHSASAAFSAAVIYAAEPSRHCQVSGAITAEELAPIAAAVRRHAAAATMLTAITPLVGL